MLTHHDTPRRLTAHILAIWSESDASWALSGDSGRDLLLGAATLSEGLSGESQLVSSQAAPHMAGDLDWSARTRTATQTAVQRETSSTHSSSTRAPCCWHGQPATAPTDHLLHGRAKHDARAERSLGAGDLPSFRPVWHTR